MFITMSPESKTKLKGAVRAFGVRYARGKFLRLVPGLGTLYAMGGIVGNVGRKGLKRGGLDSALDLLPFVGPAKGVYETFAGDIIEPPRPVPYRSRLGR